MRALCLFLLPVSALCLSSCDSIKAKALAVIDEKIEETGGYPDPSAENPDGDVAAPGAEVVQPAIRQLASHDYDAFTSIPGRVVIVDFYADWCGPCRQLAPVLEGIATKSNGKVLLGKVDVDKHKDLKGREKVKGIPDVRIFVDGKQVDRFVGAPPAIVVNQRIQEQLVSVRKSSPKPKSEPAKPKPEPTKPEDKPKPGDQPEASENPEGSGEKPTIKPMDKDWLPPGIQRKGT